MIAIAVSEPGQIWVQFSPQDTVGACEALYADNDTVQGFFPWGINRDTTLQWLIDSGCKNESEVISDSTGWGNYSNDNFSIGARGNYTGAWEQAKANNIYDLAGNNREWTQERYGELNSSSNALAQIATGAQFATISGAYFDRSTKPKKSSELSYSTDNREELWEKSCEYCGLKR